MEALDQIRFWVDLGLWYGLIALRLWALLDCLLRKASAFPAAGKLTKPAWSAILVAGAVFGTLLGGGPIGLLSLVSVVAAAVYLADVRPAVREVSGNNW